MVILSPTILLLFVILSEVLLALVVFSHNSRSPAHRFFTLFVLSLVGWTVSITVLQNSPTLLWGRLAFFFPSLLVPSLFLFANNFPDKIYNFSDKFKYLLWGVSLLFALISMTKMMVISISTTPGVIEGQTGPLFPIFSFYFLIAIVSSFYLLYKQYKNAQGIKILQIKYVFAGIVLFTFGAVTTNLLLPILGIYSLNAVGPLFSIVMIVAISYAIVKHRLMDIRLALRSLLVRILLICLFSGIFYLVFLLYELGIITPEADNIRYTILLVAVLLVIFYEPLNKLVRVLTNQILFQKEYSHQELLKNLGKIMSSSLNLDEVLENLNQTLVEVMQVKFVGFVLWDHMHYGIDDNKQFVEDGGESQQMHTWGFDTKSKQFQWKLESNLVKELSRYKGLIVFDELLREVSETSEKRERKRKEKILDEMRRLDAGVVMPLPASEGISGIVVLGEKKGGDAFTSGDINTLETLMYQAGVAVENASLFSEVQQFNVKLRKEVARATEDLALKNRSLTILRHLDQVIISSLGIQEMAQKIVDTISWELGYKGGMMVLFDKSKKKLKAVALSNTPHYKKVFEILPLKLTDYTLPIDLDPSNFIIRAVNERKPLYTKSFEDLYVPAIPKDLANQLQKAIGAKHNLVYPLTSRDEVIGAIIFELPKSFAQFDEHEQSLIEAFIEESGIAINNAMLYEELQRVNEQLKNANQRLRELDQMKDELVSVASHELRTPMTAIKGFLWMALNKQGDSLNDKVKEYLERSYQSTERLIDLVNDMLSVSRLEGKRVEVDPKEIKLEDFIESVFLDLSVKAKEKKLSLTFEKSMEDLPNVQADETRLREILMNLLGNALKFTEKGKIWVTAEAVPAQQEGVDKPMVKIGVHDTGKGIAEENLPRLFTKFGRIEEEKGTFISKADEGGTGLGLYITKGYVELHGGEIWAESKLKEGSHFYFTIPQA